MSIKIVTMIGLVGLGPAAFAADSSADEVRALRREVQELKASQAEILKNLQIVKDILLGKQPPLENIEISLDGAFTLGEKTAKVAMIEFADYQCPYCRDFAVQTFSQVVDTYVKTGRVRYVFRNFPLKQLHSLAEKAAEAAQCAGEEGKYWEAHDRFFKNPQALEMRDMPSNAAALGLDAAKFQRCLDSGKYEATVQSDLAEGMRLGVKGTPTFFFGYADLRDPSKIRVIKLLSGAAPFDNYKQVLDDLLDTPRQGSDR